ncbi:MAG: hypothetical protein AB7O96_09935, partial [Pseudobdellovibrionaceae bacterium]
MRRLLILVTFVTLAGCSAKKEKEEASVDSNVVAAGLKAVADGMGSSMSSGDDLAAASVNAFDTDVDVVCSNTGYAYGSGDEGAPADAPARGTVEYAARNSYCNLRKSPDGPDTIRGAIDRVQAFICAAGALNYDGVERTVTISITTECFSQAFVDMAAEEGITSADVPVTAYDDPSELDGNADYDKAIKIDLSGLGVGIYHIQYSADDSKFSAQMLSLQGASEDWWASVVFDRTDAANSVLRVDGRFNGNNDDSEGRRYVRAHVTGETADGEFTGPSLVEFILFDVYANTGNTAIPDGVTWTTMKGNSSDGYKIWSSSASGSDIADDIYDYAAYTSISGCIGDGACASNDGLVIDSAP